MLSVVEKCVLLILLWFLTYLAAQINTKLCDKFSVGHYPMLFWGPPTKFSAGWEPNQAKTEIHVIDDGRTAERLLNWINKQIGRYAVSSFITYLIYCIFMIRASALVINCKGNYEGFTIHYSERVSFLPKIVLMCLCIWKLLNSLL